MYTGLYQMAGQLISITSVFQDVQRLCAGYAGTGTPDLSITTSQADIDAERIRNTEESALFSDGYLETLAVYRKISDEMLRRNTLLFHGSAIAVDGAAYLFTATSGTGKSTHARLWRQLLGQRAVMVNDDKPLLQIREDGVRVCGTPWDGKHRLSTNVIVPLRAICVLERGVKNSICEISVREVLPMLMQQSFHPSDPRDLDLYLSLLDGLGKKLRFYRLCCNMDPQAAELSYGVLSGTAQAGLLL